MDWRSLLLALMALPVTWTVWSIYSFYQNYNLAKQTGLPILFAPIDRFNLFWLVAPKPLAFVLRNLPFGLGSFVRYGHMGWQYVDKYRIHEEVGGAFVIVTPAAIEVQIADALAVYDISLRKNAFPKPRRMYIPLEIFGPNLDTTNGGDWQRHKRVTAPPFNEKNNKVVWNEALRHASQLVQIWTGRGEDGFVSTINDLSRLTLQVISFFAFGRRNDLKTDQELEDSSGHSQDIFPETLHYLLRHVVALMLLPKNILKFSYILPSTVRKTAETIRDYQIMTNEMIQQERNELSEKDSNADNLLTAMVRTEVTQTVQDGSGLDGKRTVSWGLTDEEIKGNVFIFGFAGHDTTANTLSYCIFLLAANPEWQDWIAEETTRLVKAFGPVETWDYEKVFPQLKRTLAALFETLRLYGPVSFIPKTTVEARTISIEGKDYWIPPDTELTVNCTAIHSLPRYWGSDSLVWRPSRFIDSTESKATGDPSLERFLTPEKGRFVAWSDGGRICPGKKFAQVEFVAVISKLLSGHRVSGVPSPGEEVEATQARIRREVEDSLLYVTLQMRNPHTIPLRWEKVGSESVRSI
ncbi:MAG: hypothetical protein M4579_005534 [Chaenotheca gracillima]|nr:MAG: hypothetical protein M4579_005534 [Chaenotheca gracillima]